MAMLECCKTALSDVYQAWLKQTAAQTHPWMLDNLRMVLTSTLGNADILSGARYQVKVAYIHQATDRFTWAQRMHVNCPTCSERLELFIITSNSMFFLLRLLLIASALFVAVERKDQKAIFTFKDASDDMVEQVHAAMEIYRGRRELTDATMNELFGAFGQVPDKYLQGDAAALYGITVIWLLFHEIGHALNDQSGIAPPASAYLNAQQLTELNPQRRQRWLEELSADVTASWLLMGATPNRNKARDIGFGGGVVALSVFELYEGYDIGKRAIAGEKDAATAIEFRTHPPMRMRQHFLETTAKMLGGLDESSIEPWRRVLQSLFADYVDRYPMPD